MRVGVAAALVLSLCAPVAAKFKLRLGSGTSITHVIDQAEKQCLNKNVDGATMTLLTNWRPGRLVSKEQGMRLLDACLMKSGQLGSGCLFGDKLCNWANSCLEGNCKNPPMATALLEVNQLFSEKKKEKEAIPGGTYSEFSCTCPGGVVQKAKKPFKNKHGQYIMSPQCTMNGVFCESCNDGFKLKGEECIGTCGQFEDREACAKAMHEEIPLSCKWKPKRTGAKSDDGKCEYIKAPKWAIGGMPEGKTYDFVIGPVLAPGTWIMHCAVCNLALNLAWWYQNDKPTISQVPIIKDIDNLIWDGIIPSLTTPEGMKSGKLPDGVKWPIDTQVTTTTLAPDPADPHVAAGIP